MSKGWLRVPGLKYVEGNNWVTITDGLYQASDSQIYIPVGFETDFASVPRMLASFLPKAGPSSGPAVLHDYLWRVLVPRGELTHREADGILRQALRLAGVPFVTRWGAWAAVRYGALTRPNGKGQWYGDAPLVLLWTLVLLPGISVSAVGNLVGMLWTFILEVLAWPWLKLFTRTKKVNPPNPGINT